MRVELRQSTDSKEVSLTGFAQGILLCRATNAHINGMTVTNNTFAGIQLDRSDNNRINGSAANFPD